MRTSRNLQWVVGNKLKKDKMENSNYTEAAKRVKKLKNFYNSIPVYIVVCLAYFAFCTGLFDDGAISSYIPWWSPVIMASCWGMGLLIYYFYITRGSKIEHKYKKWEQRKIKEYLEQEEEKSSSINNWD